MSEALQRIALWQKLAQALAARVHLQSVHCRLCTIARGALEYLSQVHEELVLRAATRLIPESRVSRRRQELHL